MAVELNVLSSMNVGPCLIYKCGQGRLSPYQNRRNSPPTRGSSKGGSGGCPQSAPTRPPNGIFVEYNWTPAMKIMLFYW